MNPNQTLVAVCNAFKKLMFSLFFIGACSAFAQVGVGTQAPQTALHVAGANANTNGTTPGALAAGDGVIVTRVTDDLSGGAVTTGCSAATQGALVYSTNAAGTGYYTCDGTNWVALVGAAGPDFTVGTGGVLTVTLDGTNHDFSSNTTNNSFHITTTGGFGNDAITLPTPATNVGRIIVIKNNGGKGVSVSNAFDPNTAVIGTRAGIYICDGVHWVNSTN